MWRFLLLLAGLVPLGVLLAIVSLERWRRKRRGERSPLSEKLLRPAGYSLQRKLEDWWVTLKANSDVKVLSGKQVASFIATEPAKLSDKLIQQIGYQLEQRCRDVEF